jgi:hypothetical protein
MDLPPTAKQKFSLLRDRFQRASNIVPLHPLDKDQFGPAVRATQIDLGVAIAKHVHVRGLVVVHEDYNSQAVGATNCDHRVIT